MEHELLNGNNLYYVRTPMYHLRLRMCRGEMHYYCTLCLTQLSQILVYTMQGSILVSVQITGPGEEPTVLPLELTDKHREESGAHK